MKTNNPNDLLRLSADLMERCRGTVEELIIWSLVYHAFRQKGDSVRALETLVGQGPLNPEVVLLRLGHAAYAAGDRALALRSFLSVYDSYPLSDQAADAATILNQLSPGSLTPSVDSLGASFARAEQLYDAKRFADAKKAFGAIRNVATGDDLDRRRCAWRSATSSCATHWRHSTR